MRAKVEQILRRIDHRVLGEPKKVYAPGEVKPAWARTSRDDVASLRAEVEQLRRRVEALEAVRGERHPTSAPAAPRAPGRS